MKVKNVKNMIKDELLSSCNEYEFKTIKCSLSNNKNIELIELTNENVKKVETMLRYNPDYPQFINVKDLSDIKRKDIFKKIIEEKDFNAKKDRKKRKYEYSSTYYIIAFMVTIKDGKLNEEMYKYFINVILRKISSENSTRTSLEALTMIADRICKEFTIDELKKCLEEPYEKDNYIDCEYNLIECISKKTFGNHNFSLATKFCHYLNFNLYLNTDYVNLFSIYDRVVQENLHYYYNYYVEKEKSNVDKPLKNKYGQKRKYNYDSSELKDLDDEKVWEKLIKVYREYQTIVDEIIFVTNISRNGFDHLVWYTGKYH